MFCLRSKLRINELIRILQTKIHGVLRFHDRYIGGPTLAISKIGNREYRNGERGMGNGESLKGGISKMGNL